MEKQNPQQTNQNNNNNNAIRINDEIKTLFSKSAKTMISTHNNTNNTVINVQQSNLAPPNEVPQTATVMIPSSGALQQQQQHISNKMMVVNNNNVVDPIQQQHVNNNNMMASKKIVAPPPPPAPSSSLQQPHQQHQQQIYQHRGVSDSNGAAAVVDPMLEHSASVTFNDAYLSDDFSQLQIIDDKSLLNALKTKFEMKKYYVIMNRDFFLILLF